MASLMGQLCHQMGFHPPWVASSGGNSEGLKIHNASPHEGFVAKTKCHFVLWSELNAGEFSKKGMGGGETFWLKVNLS